MKGSALSQLHAAFDKTTVARHLRPVASSSTEDTKHRRFQPRIEEESHLPGPIPVALSDWARDFEHAPTFDEAQPPPGWEERSEAAWQGRTAHAPWLQDFVAYSQLRDVASQSSPQGAVPLPAVDALHAEQFDRIFALAQDCYQEPRALQAEDRASDLAQAWIEEFQQWQEDTALYKNEGRPTRAPPPIPTHLTDAFQQNSLQRTEEEVARVQHMIQHLMTSEPPIAASSPPETDMMEEEIASLLNDDVDLFQEEHVLHPIAPFPERQPPNSRSMNLRQTWEMPEDALDR